MRNVAILLVIYCFLISLFAINKPFLLKKGDTVAVIATANTMKKYNIERLKKGIKKLQEVGFKVKYRKDLFTREYGYLAGTDEERAKEFQEAFLDKNVKAVITAAGGYGCMRFLNLVDWNKIKKHPKIFIGFSDNTALHLAINKKCGFPSVHGTGVIFLWGNAENRPYAFRHLLALITDFYKDKNVSFSNWGGDDFDRVKPLPVKVVNEGSKTAKGVLIGGNLSLVSSLIGTPYEPDWKGKILFIEDVHEDIYRIDRMLCQLKLAGVFDKVNGVILGTFRKCEADKDEPCLTLWQVFDDYFKGRPYPVIANFPTGHIEDNLPLPEGVKVEISVDKPYLKILEKPFIKEK